LFAFPLIGAILVAISRTEDYRHHWHDVTIGALLGTLCAFFAYRQYYPGLSHDSCGDPFSYRVSHCKRPDVEFGAESNHALLSHTQTIDHALNHKHQVEEDEGSYSNRNPTNNNIPLDTRNN
jgi:hypothetical protein